MCRPNRNASGLGSDRRNSRSRPSPWRERRRHPPRPLPPGSLASRTWRARTAPEPAGVGPAAKQAPYLSLKLDHPSFTPRSTLLSTMRWWIADDIGNLSCLSYAPRSGFQTDQFFYGGRESGISVAPCSRSGAQRHASATNAFSSLSEGIYEEARSHVLSLEIEPDTWAITPSLTGIHWRADYINADIVLMQLIQGDLFERHPKLEPSHPSWRGRPYHRAPLSRAVNHAEKATAERAI